MFFQNLLTLWCNRWYYWLTQIDIVSMVTLQCFKSPIYVISKSFLHPVVHNSWSVIWIFSHALLSSHNENSETGSGLNVLYACLLADYNLWLPLPYPDTQLEHCLWHVFTPCYQVMMFYLTNFSSLLSPNRGQKSLFYSDKQAFNLSGYMIAHPDDIPCLMLAHQQRK